MTPQEAREPSNQEPLTEDSGVQEAMTAQGSKLRLMTLNIPFFPLGIKMGRHDERIAALAQILKQMKPEEERPHIIGFQEIWDTKAKDKLVAALKELYPYHDKDKATGSLVNSGLMIFSQYPISKSGIKHYTDSFGDEAVAKKGVMGATISLPGKKHIHIFITHLQSTSKPEANEVKIKQLTEAKAFIDEWTVGDKDPVLLMGDFNLSVEKNPEPFAQAKALFPYLRDLYKPPPGKEQKGSTWAGIEGTGFTQHIDHMWVLREPTGGLGGYAYLLTSIDKTLTGHLALWGTISLDAFPSH